MGEGIIVVIINFLVDVVIIIAWWFWWFLIRSATSKDKRSDISSCQIKVKIIEISESGKK